MAEFFGFTLIYASCWVAYLCAVNFKIPESDIGILIFANGLPFATWFCMLANLIHGK